MRPTKTKRTSVIIAGHPTHLSEPTRRFLRAVSPSWLCEALAKAQALRTGAKACRPIPALPLQLGPRLIVSCQSRSGLRWERLSSGRWFARYIAEWPKSDGTTGTASFSVNLYGEEDAFELAVYRRRKGLRELGLPRAYYERVSDNKCGKYSYARWLPLDR